MLKTQFHQDQKLHKQKQQKQHKTAQPQLSDNKKIMTSISLLSINQQQQPQNTQNSVILPRFHKQFIGIGHQLEQKKKQRKKIQDQQRLLANRVIFLQKQQIKAQKTLKKKKSQLNKVIETVQRNNFEKQQKQHLRQMRQIELQALREENKNRRLMHKEAQQTSRFIVQSQKHQTYSRIKGFIKQKEQQKKDFLFDDMKNKKDRWMSLNIDKQKGKQKIDKFYKIKNTQHTLNYMQRIQRQQETKLQKMHTIKHLQMFQNALRKKLEESSMKVSQVQDKILQTSRTLQVRRSTSHQQSNDLLLPRAKPIRNKHSNLSSYTITPTNPQQHNELNIDFEKQQASRDQQSAHKQDENDGEIEEKIGQPHMEEIQMSGFKIIRTLKRRKKSTKDRYKEYMM